MVPRGLWLSGRRALALLLIVVLVGAACTVTRTTPGSASAPTATAAPSNVLTSISKTPTSTAAATSTTTNAPSTSTPGDLATAIIQVANTVKPGVVEITNEQTSVSQLSQPIPVGTGTGFIYDNQGHILTNNHVVEGANQLVVTLPDGRTFKGSDVKTVGTDPLTDLAVLQITGSNLPSIQLGDSSQLQVGQWVVAVGYALGLEGQPTVTDGVVSALGRTVQEPSSNSGPGSSQSSAAGPYLFDVIQTNAAINPGNSGGPLTDLNGRVVGINTLVAGQAEPGIQAEGIGFAIGINTAKKVADQIVSTGHATHAYMGIEYVPLTPTVAAQMNVTATQGALIQAVVPGSPAEKAGLQKGDIITQIDGKQLSTDSALAEIVDTHKPGDTVTLTVQRGGQTQSIKLTLGTHPAS